MPAIIYCRWLATPAAAAQVGTGPDRLTALTGGFRDGSSRGLSEDADHWAILRGVTLITLDVIQVILVPAPLAEVQHKRSDERKAYHAAHNTCGSQQRSAPGLAVAVERGSMMGVAKASLCLHSCEHEAAEQVALCWLAIRLGQHGLGRDLRL